MRLLEANPYKFYYKFKRRKFENLDVEFGRVVVVLRATEVWAGEDDSEVCTFIGE